MALDLVIPLNNKSIWKDNELRYALRSVEMHLKGYRDIYIIGKTPIGITNVNHIPSQDQYPYPARNIFTKIMKACRISEISENFLFMNDDHFLLNNFNAATFPYYYKGFLKEDLNNPTNYKHTIQNTINILNGSHPLKNFDTHTPIVYNKRKFVEITDIFDWTTPHAFAIKSLYCNTLNIPGEHEPDGKIRRAKIDEMIELYLKDKKVFSVDDSALNSDMKKYLQKLYPNPSKYELYQNNCTPSTRRSCAY